LQLGWIGNLEVAQRMQNNNKKKKLNLIQIELALPHTDAQAEQKK